MRLFLVSFLTYECETDSRAGDLSWWFVLVKLGDWRLCDVVVSLL